MSGLYIYHLQTYARTHPFTNAQLIIVVHKVVDNSRTILVHVN